jgi:hypothetical protein
MKQLSLSDITAEIAVALDRHTTPMRDASQMAQCVEIVSKRNKYSKCVY